MENKFEKGQKVVVKHGDIVVVSKNHCKEMCESFNKMYSKHYGKDIVDLETVNDAPVNLIKEEENGYVIDENPEFNGLEGVIIDVVKYGNSVFYVLDSKIEYEFKEANLELIS